jgi:hypothetical protein
MNWKRTAIFSDPGRLFATKSAVEQGIKNLTES